MTFQKRLILLAGLALTPALVTQHTARAEDPAGEPDLGLAHVERIERSCATGGCHNATEKGQLDFYTLVSFASPAVEIQQCLEESSCYDAELSAANARACYQTCYVDKIDELNTGGYFYATLRDGIVKRLKDKAGITAATPGMTMPPSRPRPENDLALPVESFRELMQWVVADSLNGYRELFRLRGPQPETPYEAACGTVAPEILATIDDDYYAPDQTMLGCPNGEWPENANECLKDFPTSPIVSAEAAAKGVVVRVLRVLEGRPNTAYWSRSSPDGRFVLTGNGHVEDLAVDGRFLVIDNPPFDPKDPKDPKQPKDPKEPKDPKGTRGGEGEGDGDDIQLGGWVATIDPVYSPDGKFYAWPGMICPATPLYDLSLTQIGPRTPESACRSSDMINTYAAMGADKDGDVFMTDGPFNGNGGFDTSDSDAQPYKGYINFKHVKGGTLEVTEPEGNRFDIPGETDFILGPSGELMTSRHAIDGEQRYRIRLVKDASGALAPQVNETTATVCIKGEKSTLSFDNRFMAFHHHADGSPQDGDAEQGLANVFVYDVKTGEHVRVTDMKAGAKAYFPHFRADGWIYFLVKEPLPDEGRGEGDDGGWGRRYKETIMATNAALILKSR